MPRPVTALILLCCVALAGATLARDPRGDDRSERIHFPSDRFSDLQEAIDAATAGPELVLAPGVYELERPLIVRGPVKIVGAGCSEFVRAIPRRFRPDMQTRVVRKRSWRSTRLVGPKPDRLTPADVSAGVIEFVGPRAGGTLRGIELVGFDAGVLVPAMAPPSPGEPTPVRGEATTLTLDRVCVNDAGRGVLVRSPIPLTITDSVFEDLLGNGISFTSQAEELFNHFSIKKTLIHNIGYSCMFLYGITAIVGDAQLVGCGPGGGIQMFHATAVVIDTLITQSAGPGIQAVGSTGSILDSLIDHSVGYGMLFVDSSFTIQESVVNETAAFANGFFGDGITSAHSNGFLFDVRIEDSDRAGLSNFGGDWALQDVAIQCSAYDLEGELFLGVPFAFHDQGGNTCGCPTAAGTCTAESASLQPPDPTAPIE